eukprot:gene20329-biopygen23555
MGLGPQPVEPALCGGGVGVQGTAQRPPPAWRRRPATPHMSGVGAPAIRPRNCRAGPCTAPKKRPRPRPRLYVWGWGPSCTAPPCSAGA